MEHDVKARLDDILCAQLLILSKLMDAERKGKGAHRFGGDYTQEAASLLKDQRAHLLELLR